MVIPEGLEPSRVTAESEPTRDSRQQKFTANSNDNRRSPGHGRVERDVSPRGHRLHVRVHLPPFPSALPPFMAALPPYIAAWPPQMDALRNAE
eukprot:270268-Rhodomonas_salina.2